MKTLQVKKNYEEAERCLDMSLEAAENDESDYEQVHFIAYAEVKSQMKKYDKAIELYNKALGCEGEKNAEIYCKIGFIYKDLNNINQAIVAFKEALKINPSDKKAKEQLKQLEKTEKSNQDKKETNKQNRSKNNNTQQTYTMSPSKEKTSKSPDTEATSDIYYSFVSSRGNLLGGPYRYQHMISKLTTFKDMRKNIVEDLEIDSDINVDNFFFSQRAERPLFLDENLTILENISLLEYDQQLKNRHIYLCPRIRYKLMVNS